MLDKNMTKSKRTYIVNKVGALKTSGSLVDPATGAVNLTDGQIGLLNSSTNASDTGVKVPLNRIINGASTTALVPEVKIVQGTSKSANPASDLRPGTKRPYESSARIEGDEKIILQVRAARPPANSVWKLGSVNLEDLTEYGVRIAFLGAYHNIFYSGGHTSIPVYPVSVVTPDYTQLITDTVFANTTEAKDHFYKTLVVETNKNSHGLNPTKPLENPNELVLAVAVATDGAATGTLTISDYTNITSVTVGAVTLTNGVAFTSATSNSVTAGLIADAINANTTLNALGVFAVAVGAVITVSAPGVASNSIALSDVGTGVTASAAALSGGFGVGISTLVAGGTVAIEKINGVNGNPITKSYTFDAEEILSLNQTFTAGTEVIVLADTSTATGTPSTPSEQVDTIAFLGLDRELFLGEDRLPEVKTRLDIGLVSGFNTSLTSLVEGSFASDGVNTVKQILNGYEETQARRDNDVQYRGQGMTVIKYPSDVLSITVPQDVVVVTHAQSQFSNLASRSYNLEETYLLTDASVDSDGLSVNTKANISADGITLGSKTQAFITAFVAWANQNNVRIQIRYDA